MPPRDSAVLEDAFLEAFELLQHKERLFRARICHGRGVKRLHLSRHGFRSLWHRRMPTLVDWPNWQVNVYDDGFVERLATRVRILALHDRTVDYACLSWLQFRGSLPPCQVKQAHSVIPSTGIVPHGHGLFGKPLRLQIMHGVCFFFPLDSFRPPPVMYVTADREQGSDAPERSSEGLAAARPLVERCIAVTPGGRMRHYKISVVRDTFPHCRERRATTVAFRVLRHGIGKSPLSVSRGERRSEDCERSTRPLRRPQMKDSGFMIQVYQRTRRGQ